MAASAALSGAFSIMWANGWPGSTSPANVRNTGRTACSSFEVGHHHVEDRLRVVRHRVPHAERLEHAPRRGRDRGGAQVGPRIRGEGRIGHHDPERVAQPLPQRERKREPGKAAARDHHIGSLKLISAIYRHSAGRDTSP